MSDFEGGVRAAGFLNGGFLDAVNPALRGSAFHGLVHGCDWCAPSLFVWSGAWLEMPTPAC